MAVATEPGSSFEQSQNVAPVTVPGTVERGDGIHVPANLMTLRPASPAMVKRLKPAYELLDNAVADGAFPSGVLAVGLHDELIVHPFGRLTRDAKSPAVTADTIYHVASLTKPIVTTTAIMRLVQRGELSLDAPVVRFLPEWAKAAPSDPDPSWRARVTVRMLLFHDSAYHLAGLDQRYGTPGCIEDYYDP